MLYERYEDNLDIQQRFVARICAAAINSSFKFDRKKPFTEEDFLPKQEQTVDEQIAILSRVNVGE